MTQLLHSTEKYNRYVEILGGMIGEGACNVAHAENRLEKMHDECLISYFLSGKLSILPLCSQ